MKIKSRLPKVYFSELKRVLRHFGGHLRPYRKSLTLAGLSLIGLALVEVGRPWPLKVVFDYVLFPGRARSGQIFTETVSTMTPLTILSLACLAVVVLSVLGGLFSYGQNYLFSAVGQKISGAIRLQLFSHIQSLPQSYHDTRETGDLMMRMTGDINLLKDLLVNLLVTLGSRFLIIGGMLAMMFWLDWQLTLVTLAVIPLLVATQLRFSGRIKAATRKQRAKEGQLATSVHDFFSGISVTRTFAREKKQEKLLSKSVGQDVKAGLKATRLEAAYSRMVEIITALGTCAVLWFGVRRVLVHSLSPGDLLVFIAYMRVLYKPLRDVAQLSARVAKATACGERVLEIIDIKPAVVDQPDAISAAGIKGEIQFNGVEFGYRPDRPVLKKITCRIPAGKTTAVVGPSGAGKSTIAKLLLRFYEPQQGSITIDGLDLRSYKIHSLRKRLTSLSQETFLFQTSLRENIGFADSKATPDQIEAAARKVGAEQFIRELPDGFDTVVGEGGLTLSGGQRQRIAFARAALRNSPIMIFDEPATGLDHQAEQVVKDALAYLREGRTLILITHRLNFIDLADWIILLENGEVKQTGSPEALLGQPGAYRQFYAAWLKSMGTRTGRFVSRSVSLEDDSIQSLAEKSI